MSNGQQLLRADVQMCHDTGRMLGMVSKVIFGGASFRHKHLVLEPTYLHIKAGEGAFHPEASLTRIGIDCVNYEDTEKGPGVSFRYQHKTYHIAFASEEQRNQWFDCLAEHASQKSPQPERKRDSHTYHTAASQMQGQQHAPSQSPDQQPQQQQQQPAAGPVDRLPSYNTSEMQQQEHQQLQPPDQTQSSQSGLQPPSYQEASHQAPGAKSF